MGGNRCDPIIMIDMREEKAEHASENRLTSNLFDHVHSTKCP